jgi:hypothetical protein
MKATKNARKVRFETEIHNDTQLQKPYATTTDPNRKEKFTKTLIIHCRHEQRLEALKSDMHRIYGSIFHGTPAMDIKLIVGHTNNRSAKRDLTRARPNMKLLNPMKKPSENYIPFYRFQSKMSTGHLFVFHLEQSTTTPNRRKHSNHRRRSSHKQHKNQRHNRQIQRTHD